MKLKTTCFILLTAITFIAKAQYVTIPDTNFAAWLNANIPSAMSNGNQMDTTSIDVTSLISIDISDLGITNLDGIQYFDSLQDLKCFDNLINPNLLTSIPALPSSLINLDCSRQQLANLPVLPNSLLTLKCPNNQLISLPALPNTLKVLDYSFNYNLNNVFTLPDSLQTLICTENGITTLPVLPSVLIYLDCSHNPLTSLPALPDSLQDLRCIGNTLSSLPILPSNLKQLICTGNSLTNLPPLPGSLLNLDCSNNLLSNLPNLPSQFQRLHCNNNQLINLPTLPSSLLFLYCGHNLLTEIPPLPNGLRILYCEYNSIHCFPKFPNSLSDSITNPDFVWSDYFEIGYNPFTCLPNYLPKMSTSQLSIPLCIEGDTVGNSSGCPSFEGITGTLFADNNNNCLLDSTETGVKNISIKLFNNGNLVSQTNSFPNGAYYFSETSNTYTVKLDTLGMPFLASCNIDSTFTTNNINPLATNINFPLTCKPGYDVGVQSIATSGWVFPGQQHTLRILAGDISHWYNLHCADGIFGQLQLLISGPVTYTGITPNALTPAITGNTFTYQISDFGLINNSEAFGLLFTTDTTAQAGDAICVNATVTSGGNDNNTANNTYQFCYSVINSYDPNMKEVYPVNVLPGYQDWFTYTIHFQNTGSAPAFNIRLTDTLNNNFDLETFQVINYSHYNTVSLQNNALSFRFPNIMLPDSTSNPEGSKGFVQYRIKPKPNMSLGTQIHNTAYIYFDYNPAIITNTTINEFTQPNSLKENELSQLKIYPNPGTGNYSVILPQWSELKCIRLDVYNVFGEIVGNSESLGSVNSDKKIVHININQQPNGIYFVKGEINGRFFYQRIVKQ